MDDRQPADPVTSGSSASGSSAARSAVESDQPRWHHASVLAGVAVGVALLVSVLGGDLAWSNSDRGTPERRELASDLDTEVAGPPAPEPAPEPAPTPRAKRVLKHGPLSGIVLGLFSQDPSYDYTKLLLEIRETGSPWVSIMVNNYQAKNDSDQVGVADPKTPPLARVRVTIGQARAVGLRVLLFPILLIQHPEDEEWRGTLAPKSRTKWHDSYRAMMLRYARLAADENVDLLSIGSEFNSLQGDTSQWAETIRQLRAIYDGPLTYSANWDSLDGVSFMAHLDLIGMTTYHGLSKENDPSVDTMVSSWRTLQSDIHEWNAFHGIPLLFTEVGYPSQDGANQNPWNYYHSTEVDLVEQRDCFEAFSRVWTHDPTVSGVFFYNWFGEGGPSDTGYTPRGKPALKLIRRWFEEHRTKSAAPTGG